MPTVAWLARVKPSHRTATLEHVTGTCPGISLADQANSRPGTRRTATRSERGRPERARRPAPLLLHELAAAGTVTAAGPHPRRPEGIHITDNAIIPLKERVVDPRYDPLFKLARRIAARRGR